MSIARGCRTDFGDQIRFAISPADQAHINAFENQEMTMFSLTFGTKCGALAAILTIAAAVLSTPASATKVSEAVALCKKNPNCHISGQGKGGTVLCIGTDPRGGCARSVICDPKSQGGKCWAAKRAPG